MPDFVDIMIANALTPQGQIGTAAVLAQKAVREANEAVANINAITEQTQQNNADAAAALENAETAIEQAQTAQQLIEDMLDDVDTAIDSMDFSTGTVSTNDVIRRDIFITYPSQKEKTLTGVAQYYSATGQNEDGTMTQKAITDALTSINETIESLEPTPDMGEENSGKIVVIDENGNLVPGDISQQEIINAIQDDTPSDNASLGLEIDYKNKSTTHMYSAVGRTSGEDFDRYSMYGGRMRCNVADDGTITAFYGDSNYAEDGSNGQVMVYQPKFYYSRVPEIIENDNIIRKETIAISAAPQLGFKVHPLFVNNDGQEVDYVLFSAYEGSAYLTATSTYDLQDSSNIDFETDKLSSIAGAKPISGVNKALTLANAKKLAKNRGTNWQLTNMKFESAMQMLEMIEFGILNGQVGLEKGICSIPNNSSVNCASITGSTSILGNATGAANATQNETNGTYITYTDIGKRAISYRGVENPWGNIWRLIDDFQVVGNGSQRGGIGQIYNQVTQTYESVAFTIPSVYDWISAFGYDSAHDWIFLPVECTGANSALLVGDNIWTIANLNDTCIGLAGGLWHFEDNNGPFYYAFDKKPTDYGRSYSARLMFIPAKNSIYETNLAAWKNKWE